MYVVWKGETLSRLGDIMSRVCLKIVWIVFTRFFLQNRIGCRHSDVWMISHHLAVVMMTYFHVKKIARVT